MMGDSPVQRPGGEILSRADSDPPPSIGSTYAPGDRIADRYQLLRMLDQGGMGVVWVAHHLALDVHVALKLVRPEAGSEQAAERLLLEAQSAARLNHPAILRVLDVGKTREGDPFLVMELLDGEVLADVLEREGRLDAITAVRTILPIADALSALHAKGILHRDVKPENIFLARCDSGRWQPKLIDFGVAKLEQRAAKRLTKQGMAVGTPSYMSPEQLKGEETDGRSDVWAFSVVLYETLTGALPFEGETHVLLLLALLDSQARPISTYGVGDEELWAILQRGFAPKERRWPSVREMGKALARWLWARQVMDDVGGVALRQSWLDEQDVQDLSSVSSPAPSPAERSSVPVRARLRVDATKELAARPTSTAPPTSTTRERGSEGNPAVTPPASQAGGSRRRFVLGVAAALAGAGAGVSAVVWLGRAPGPASGAGEPAATPSASVPGATASASATPVPTSAPGASHGPGMSPPSSSPSPSSSPKPHAGPQPAALPQGLKDPFR